MKSFKFAFMTLMAVVIGMCITPSCTSAKPYKVYWEGNALYMEMPWPTIGIVGVNQVDWGFKLSDAIEDAYKTLKRADGKGSTVYLYARFNFRSTDKYGNRTGNSKDYLIAKVSISEVKKYQSSGYFDSGYSISRTIDDIIHHRR